MMNCRVVWVGRETHSLKIILIVIVKKWWFWRHGSGLKMASCSYESYMFSCRGLGLRDAVTLSYLLAHPP